MHEEKTRQDRLMATTIAAAACAAANDPLVRSVHVISPRRATYPELVALRIATRRADVEFVADRPDDLRFRHLDWETAHGGSSGGNGPATGRLADRCAALRQHVVTWNGGFVGIHEGVR